MKLHSITKALIVSAALLLGVTSEEKNGGFTLTTFKQSETACIGDEACEYGKHYIAFDIFLLVTTPATIGITSKNTPVKSKYQNKISHMASNIFFSFINIIAFINIPIYI